MAVNLQNAWGPRLATFSLAAMTAASAVYWVLRWPQPAAAPPLAAPTPQAAPDVQALARLLGQTAAPAAQPTLASRYALAGVLAGAGVRGAALISIDGKPAKPFRVGALVADGLYLQSVAGRRAVLAAGAADAASALVLEMAPPSR